MKILVDSVFPGKTSEAVEKCGFPVSEVVLLGGSIFEGAKNVRCPSHPGNARTSIYIMQLQEVDGLVVVWDGRDMELINLARDMQLPIFVLYQTNGFEVGLRMVEDDF